LNSARLTAGLSLLFGALVFISPLYAQSVPDEEEPVITEESFLGDDLIFEAPPLVFEASPVIELRSFDAVFPGFSRSKKSRVMSEEGLRNSFEKDDSPLIVPDPDSGIDLLSDVMKKNPSHIVEALVVVPCHERELDLLDIYNALRNIKDIKDYPINWYGNDIYIFTETTRLESARNRKPVPDPAPADMLPYSETMYLRFVDPYMGDLYLRGNISVSLYGLTYNLTNFRDVRYSVFRIMKEERFTAIIYLEPVKEGILIYSMSGLYLPNFIAKRINLTPNMNRRITVLLNWIIDGLRKQESILQYNLFYLPGM